MTPAAGAGRGGSPCELLEDPDFTPGRGLNPVVAGTAPPGPRAFFAEFTWVLPVVHLAVVGVLVLTRWWDFWTS
jgi:hypothetical protein